MDDDEFEKLMQQDEEVTQKQQQKKQTVTEKPFNAFDDDDDFLGNQSSDQEIAGGYNPTISERPPTRDLSLSQSQRRAQLFGINQRPGNNSALNNGQIKNESNNFTNSSLVSNPFKQTQNVQKQEVDELKNQDNKRPQTSKVDYGNKKQEPFSNTQQGFFQRRSVNDLKKQEEDDDDPFGIFESENKQNNYNQQVNMNQNNIQQNSSGFNNQALSQQSQSNTLKSNPTFGNQNSASKNVSNQQQIGTLPQQENPDQFKNQQSNNIDSNIGTVDIGFSRRRPSARQKQSQEQTMNSINTPLNRSQTTFNQQGGVTNFNNTAGLPPQPQQKFDNSKQSNDMNQFQTQTNLVQNNNLGQNDFQNTQKIQQSGFDAEFHKKLQEQNYKEYQEQLKILKDNYDVQLKQMNENFQKQLRYECDLKEQLSIEMNDLLKREKARQQEIHEAEIKQKEQMFEYEKQQIRRQMESETQQLRLQLEQQTKMISLNEEIKLNSNKLNQLSNKMEQTIDINNAQRQGKRGGMLDQENDQFNQIKKELDKREQLLKEIENKAQLQQENLQRENEKLEQKRKILDERELQIQNNSNQEKISLRQEYNRLSLQQEQLEKQSLEMKKELDLKNQEIQEQKQIIEKERIQMHEEFENKYRDFEMQAMLFEKIKKEFNDQQEKLNQIHQNKLKELDYARDKLRIQESELLRQQKQLQLKEMEFAHVYQENTKKQQLLNQERQEFQQQQMQVDQVANQVYQDNAQWAQFKQNYEYEQEKLRVKEAELEQRERQLKQQESYMYNEKQSISNMQNTLFSLKRDFVKDLTTQDPATYNQNRKKGFQTQQFNKSQNEFKVQKQEYKKPKTLLQTLQEVSYNSNQNILKNKDQKVNNKLQEQIQKQQKNTTVKEYQAFNINQFLDDLKGMENQQQENAKYLNQEQDHLLLKSNNIPKYFQTNTKQNNNFSNNLYQNSGGLSYQGVSFESSPMYFKKESLTSSENNQY